MDSELFVPTSLRETYTFQLATSVCAVREGELLFADTIFHPQGGGQPRDKGWVIINGLKQEITDALPDKESGKVLLCLTRSGIKLRAWLEAKWEIKLSWSLMSRPG